jgi:hypothetical protein
MPARSFSASAAGYVKVGRDRIEKNPDKRVQEAPAARLHQVRRAAKCTTSAHLAEGGGHRAARQVAPRRGAWRCVAIVFAHHVGCAYVRLRGSRGSSCARTRRRGNPQIIEQSEDTYAPRYTPPEACGALEWGRTCSHGGSFGDQSDRGAIEHDRRTMRNQGGDLSFDLRGDASSITWSADCWRRPAALSATSSMMGARRRSRPTRREPKVERVPVIRDPEQVSGGGQIGAIQSAATVALRVQLVPIGMRDPLVRDRKGTHCDGRAPAGAVAAAGALRSAASKPSGFRTRRTSLLLIANNATGMSSELARGAARRNAQAYPSRGTHGGRCESRRPISQ